MSCSICHRIACSEMFHKPHAYLSSSEPTSPFYEPTREELLKVYNRKGETDMNATQTHTETPWVRDTATNSICSGHTTLASTEDYSGDERQDTANAAHIVRCVNEREGLVDALSGASEYLNEMGCDHEDEDKKHCIVCIVNATLEQALKP